MVFSVRNRVSIAHVFRINPPTNSPPSPSPQHPSASAVRTFTRVAFVAPAKEQKRKSCSRQPVETSLSRISERDFTMYRKEDNEGTHTYSWKWDKKTKKKEKETYDYNLSNNFLKNSLIFRFRAKKCKNLSKFYFLLQYLKQWNLIMILFII